MEYVVKNIRLRNYLFSLGLDYRQVTDQTNKQKYVWLFTNDKRLEDALIFYKNYKNQYFNI